MFRSIIAARSKINWTPVVARSVPRTQFPRLTIRQYATYKRFDNRPPNSVNYWSILTSRKTIYFLGGCAAFYVYNLNEAPFTHRYRFIWIPYWLETKIGDYSYQQIMFQYGNAIVPHTNPLYGKISGIMNKLLTVAINNNDDPKQREHLKSLDWSINIIQVDPKTYPPNAFILPNGKIFIFSSILPICYNDDGLATVLSHELSHQLAHHSSEQLSKQPIYIMLSTILYTITGISWFNDLLIRGFLEMPASREMESEADRIGIELMARSCFNIKESVKFWQRMNEAEQQMAGQFRGVALQEFFSTHPATSKRIHDINQWLPDLEHIKEASGCYEYQFGRFSEFNQNFFKKLIN
ncbi:peptidase family M48-domain-containing protein [Scheffersomyces amazonensis]|uniref:peptidase family M48-domain-containing protein n=1 Tax=Scheffersomyces amazonensis TaxID=1078765 RepID=UPI00315D1A7A